MKEKHGTQAVERALSLLMLFDDEKPEWSLREIVQASGINRTTAYRLLRALEAAHMVAQDSLSGTYRLGSALIMLGARAQRANPLQAVSQTVLVALAHKTGEMASVEILEGDKTLILNEVKGDQQRRMGVSIGNRWPAHTTSTGKVLLAHLPAQTRAALWPDGLPSLTPYTITDRDALERQLEQVAAQGYAEAHSELEMGFSEVGAPICDHEGQVVAALSIGGSSMRLTRERVQELIGLVQRAALDVSVRLGYRQATLP